MVLKMTKVLISVPENHILKDSLDKTPGKYYND
jgi:hypothetical protein